MFLGHFALGMAGKRAAPAVSLGTFFLAAQLADLVWPNLVLLGVEEVAVEPGATAVTPLRFVRYPWSHGLSSLAGIALVAAILHALWRRRRGLPASPRAAAAIAVVVLSHWLLDWISHAPDLPLLGDGGARYGLGLWNSLPATLAVELGLLAVGVALYGRATVPRDRAGAAGWWALVGFLVAVYAASILGPPPPSAGAVAWTAQSMWLLVLWGAWVDRHRAPRRGGSVTTAAARAQGAAA